MVGFAFPQLKTCEDFFLVSYFRFLYRSTVLSIKYGAGLYKELHTWGIIE